MRARLLAVPCVLGALLVAGPQLLPTGAPSARVSVDQTYPVPASGKLTVRGHGYGHGHGLSQHGAQGAALKGLSHQQILAFYYPGTKLATAKHKLRVLVTADTTSDLVVEARKGLRLRDRGAGASYDLPDNGASRWRVDVGKGNRNTVAYLEHGDWHRWKPGGDRFLAGEGEFRAEKPIALVTPTRTVRYRGWLRAAAPSAGSRDRDTVNVVRLDDYVKGVVPSEMPALWEPQAVQAQAVAARTYAVWSRQQNADRYYQICDTTACQVYSGVEAEHPASNAAVRATAKQILTYGGEPAFSQFSASSGGWTSAGNAPYLVAKKDPYDGWSGNTVHDWSMPLTAGAIERAYPAVGNLRRIRVTARDGNGQWQGRVLSMALQGSKGTVTVTGDEFRYRFGLRSNWFSF